MIRTLRSPPGWRVAHPEIKPLFVLLLVRALRERLGADPRAYRARRLIDRVHLDVARVERGAHLERLRSDQRRHLNLSEREKR